MKDNPYGFFVSVSPSPKRCCHTCGTIFKGNERHLVQTLLRADIKSTHYCRKCGLKLLKISIENTIKKFTKTQLRKMFLSIKLS